MKINWLEFTKFDYWLAGISGEVSITPIVERNSSFFWLFLWVFALIIAFAILVKSITILLNEHHPLNSKLNLWGDNILWIGILGNGWFLLRQLSVGFLGSRLWLVLFFVWFLILLFFIIRYFVSFYKLEYLYYKKHYINKNG